MSDEQFPPVPGGMVDTARKAAAAQDAAPAAGQDFDGTQYSPVKVQLRVPEVASASTIVIANATGYHSVQKLIGEDGQRCKAVLLALDEPVIVCFNRPAADDPRNAVNAAGLSAGGFVLPVNVPLPLDTSAMIYVAATSATPTRVSFIRQSFTE